MSDSGAVKTWLGMWSWRIRESATVKMDRLHPRLHGFMCPFCRAFPKPGWWPL